MLVISQDRDVAVSFKKSNSIKGEIVIKEGVYYGINLIVNNRYMGTFDTLEEYISEAHNIMNCTYDYYAVNGFEDYDNCFQEVDYV